MVVPIVCAGIMPHGDSLLPIGKPDPGALGTVRQVLTETGASFRAQRPDAILLLSPHHFRVRSQLALTMSSYVEGRIHYPGGEYGGRLEVSRELARRVADASRTAGLEVAEINYATAEGEGSCLPLDWGSLIPLHFIYGGGTSGPPVCIVGPPRDIGLSPLIAVGRAIAGAMGDLRVALVASADLGHAHLASGPYGYDPAAAEYDGLVQAAVAAGDLGPLQHLPAELLEHAKADAPWQLAILHGALGGPARTLRWAYACPTYFGMLAAEFQIG